MRFLLSVTRGIIRDTVVRRWCMFVVVLVALIMVFLGSTFLAGTLEAAPWVFIFYWLICVWLTLLAMLLALYDLLVVRAAGKIARKTSRSRYFGR